MIVNALRKNKIVAGILTIVRIYLGYAWFTAGYHKIIDGFDASGYLQNAAANPVMGPDGTPVYAWYTTFLEAFAIPNADLFNFLIPWGEAAVGLGLMLGCLTTTAAFFALVMNFAFFFAGTVSHNPTDILMGFFIAIAGYNAGHYGLDRWVIPFIRKTVLKQTTTSATNEIL